MSSARLRIVFVLAVVGDGDANTQYLPYLYLPLARILFPLFWKWVSETLNVISSIDNNNMVLGCRFLIAGDFRVPSRSAIR